MHSKSSGWSKFIFALPLLFFVVFYLYPLSSIFKLSFFPENGDALEALRKLVTDNYYVNVLWFTTWQAVVSTALTLVLALPGAWVFATFTFPGKDTIRTISTLPFVLPTIVVANAFQAFLGSQGLLNSGLMRLLSLESPPIKLEQTIWLILLAHVFYNYSVALRIISSYWQSLDPAIEEAASVLGASRWHIFRTVTLPLLRSAIVAATLLVFIFTFTSFGVILVLGGPGFATLEVEIYLHAVQLFNLPVAAALSLLQIVITFVLMWFYTRSQSRISRSGRRTRTQFRPIRSTKDRLFVYSNLTLMLVLLAAPLIALVAQSFTSADGLTTSFYTALFENRRGSVFYVPPIQAVRNSIGFAAATTLLAVVLGLIGAQLIRGSSSAENEKWTPLRLLDPLFMLPLATSAVTLGFGFIITLNRPPLNLRSSLLLIPIAHALVAIPFVIRSVLPAMRSISNSLHEAAGLLGARPDQIWQTIDWPLIRRAVTVGAVFAFTISMGEFGASIFVARPETPTMPVAIYRFLGQPGALNYGQALAMSSLLMLVCAIGFLAIERFRIGDEGEF